MSNNKVKPVLIDSEKAWLMYGKPVAYYQKVMRRKPTLNPNRILNSVHIADN